MAEICLRGVVKRYDNMPIVQGFDLDIANEEFIVLVGPSGCGKSTTLRMIAGLDQVTEGEIRIDGKLVNHLPPRARDVAMVFQNYALYPHMSVRQNMAFGLKLRGATRDDVAARVAQAARVLDIEPLLERKPRALSGGQRQRVAMGRAMVREPKVFLFDEPLSNLDAKLRVQMRAEIRRLHRVVRTTTIYVTHDQVEAMTLADRVVVMNAGRIEQVGPPQELYHRPATRFIAGFIGSPGMNFIGARMHRSGGGHALRLAGGNALPLPPGRGAPCADRPIVLGIRPEHLSVWRTDHPSGTARIDVRVDVTEPLGGETLLHGFLGDEPLVAKLPGDISVDRDAIMPLALDLAHIHMIDPDTDRVF